jgi:tetratricopeptide (TPR) repeat protein
MNFARAIVLLFACLWLWLCPVARAGSADDVLAAGADAVNVGDYEKALDLFTQAIAHSPELGYSDRCLVNLQMERYSAAIADCTKALSSNPENHESLLNLGLASQRLGRYEDAILSYRQVLQLDPHDYRAYYNLGLTEAALGQPTESIISYTRALEVYQGQPGSQPSAEAAIYRDRGVSRMLLADYTAAVADLDAAIQADPDDLWAYFNRGCAYHRSQNFVPALQDFSWVISQDERNAQAYFNRGVIYAQMGQKKDAVANLQQAAQQFLLKDMVTSAERARELIDQLEIDQSIKEFLSGLTSVEFYG